MHDVPEETIETVARALWPWHGHRPSWTIEQARALFANPEATRALIEWVGSVTEPVEERT